MVALSALVLSPNAVTPAEAFTCVGSSVCNPANAWVLSEGAASTTVVTAAGAAVGGGVGIAAWQAGMFDAEDSTVLTNGTSSVAPGWTPSNTKSFRWTDLGGSPACPTDGGSCVLSTGTFTITHPLYLGTGMVNLTVKGAGPCRASFMFDVYYLTSTGALGQRPGSGYYVGNNAPGGCTGTGNYSWNQTQPFYGLAITNNSGTEQMRYYPEGNPGRPPAAPSGGGTLTRTITCKNAAGATQQISDSHHLVAQAAAQELPALGCPAGSVLSSYGSKWTPDGSTTPIDVIPETDTPWGNTLGDYPACAVGPCEMLLYLVTPQGLASCGALAIACPEWYSDPGKLENYECRYGPYTVPLSQCSTMRTPGQVRPNTKTDAEGKLEVVEWPTLAPDVTLDGPAPTPGPGTSPAPTPADEPSECYPTGWSAFNPVQWVLQPVGCALVWAFVPTQTQVTTAAIATQIQTKTPVPQIGSLATTMEPPDVASACLKLSLPIAFVIGHDQPLLDSCTWSDPVSQMLRDHRTFLTAVVWVGIATPLLWWAWRTYAPGATGTA